MHYLGTCFRVAGHLILTEGIFQVDVSGSLAIVRHGNGDEIKDWNILKQKYSIDICFLGNRFPIAGHLVLTGVISGSGWV